MDDEGQGSQEGKQYHYPRLSISLGPEPLHTKRLARIDAIADDLGVTRSALFQMLGDGELSLVRPLKPSEE